MAYQDARSAFETYLGAFAERSPVRREQMLRSSVAENIDFSNPGVHSAGMNNLLAHIVRFQDKYPGNYFVVNWIRQQHGQVLAEWRQIASDGLSFITAHSYARLNDDGRICRFAGFWNAGDMP